MGARFSLEGSDTFLEEEQSAQLRSRIAQSTARGVRRELSCSVQSEHQCIAGERDTIARPCYPCAIQPAVVKASDRHCRLGIRREPLKSEVNDPSLGRHGRY